MRQKTLPLLSNKEKKARLAFARKYHKVTAMNGKTFSLAMSALVNTFSISPTLKTMSYGALRRACRFPHRTKLKECQMDGLGWHDSLTSLHFIPQGQTVTAEYYITKILEREVKPPFSRRSTTEEPVKRKLFANKRLKKMNGQQIHLILTPLRTYMYGGASLTKMHTEIRSLRRWED